MSSTAYSISHWGSPLAHAPSMPVHASTDAPLTFVGLRLYSDLNVSLLYLPFIGRDAFSCYPRLFCLVKQLILELCDESTLSKRSSQQVASLDTAGEFCNTP